MSFFLIFDNFSTLSDQSFFDHSETSDRPTQEVALQDYWLSKQKIGGFFNVKFLWVGKAKKNFQDGKGSVIPHFLLPSP